MSDPLGPIIEAVRLKIREELINEVRNMVKDEIIAELRAQAAEVKPRKIMLSINDVGKRYGFGRRAIKEAVERGELPVVKRRCRGGHTGQFFHLSDLERCFGGRSATDAAGGGH